MIFEPEDLPGVHNTIPRGFGICRMRALCAFLAEGFFRCVSGIPKHVATKTAGQAEKRKEMEQKGSKRGLFAVIALVVVVLVLGGVYLWTRPAVSKGDKHIVVEVVHADGASRKFEYDTDAQYLREVLEPAGLIAGDESEFGMFVKTVDGYTVNDANQEWWCFTRGGGQVDTGVDTTPVADGDHFEITLTVGY